MRHVLYVALLFLAVGCTKPQTAREMRDLISHYTCTEDTVIIEPNSALEGKTIMTYYVDTTEMCCSPSELSLIRETAMKMNQDSDRYVYEIFNRLKADYILKISKRK